MIADLIVRRLHDAGVRFLSGMPGGGSNLDLIEAASGIDLPFVLAQTETGGALMAMAQAELTGTPGACLATLGPGAASIANGVACALLDRAPLLVFTDRHPGGSAATHQRLDHEALLRPVTKWSAALTAEQADATVCRALAIALDAPPGPVHLDCAADVSAAPAGDCHNGRVRRQPDQAGGFRLQPEDPALLDRLLRRSRRPLLLVGLGARAPADVTAVRALCARGVPALVTYKAKGVVPDEDASFAGVFTNGALERRVLDEADLLIGVGLDPVELVPGPWRCAQPIISCGAWAVDGGHIPFATQLVGTIPHAVELLRSLLPARTDWDLAAVARAVQDQRRAVRVHAEGLSPHEVVETVARAAGADARVTIDAGAHMFPATLLWPARRPCDLLISNGLSTMGFALPAAIGAALADRARRVIALTGDAGLLMSVAELRTAAREGVNVLTVVFADGRLSLIDVKQRQRGYREAGVGLGPIDWMALARGFGVRALEASTPAALERAVTDALAEPGPALVAARVNPSAYDRIIPAVRG